VDILPLWKRTVGFLFDKIPTGIVKKGPNVYFFKDLVKQRGEETIKIISQAPLEEEGHVTSYFYRVLRASR
jgi:hypothetical protein